MNLPMPTVEQLVQVFHDNNWTVCSGSSGAEYHNIQKGRCCAIPALLKHANQLPVSISGQALYDMVDYLYGKPAVSIWNAFDHPNDHTDNKLVEHYFIDEEQKVWLRLGRDLRYALEPVTLFDTLLNLPDDYDSQ